MTVAFEKFPPLIMRRDEVIRMKEAIALTGKSEKTIRDLFKRYRIYRRAHPTAPPDIHRVGLEMALGGDIEALSALHAGDRSHPRVVLYYSRCGLPL